MSDSTPSEKNPAAAPPNPSPDQNFGGDQSHGGSRSAPAKLWDGRFSESTHALVEAFTASVQFDNRLYKHDIRGSIAHATMLNAVGVLTTDERDAIIKGLEEILTDIEAGAFTWSAALEDVHMNIEAALTQRIGDAGKKLHTARSRNDQVATDIRLYLRDECERLVDSIARLRRVLIERAQIEAGTIMPGFTHLQTAQPVTLGHHLLAWQEMLSRDAERITDARRRLNQLPLGAAALAGTSFPIDREMVARLLEFDGICQNSLDAVSDRDFAIELVSACSLLMMHLSRMSEDLILWSCAQFGFIELGDAFCTGSSIMPQKKNPDIAELVRGKCGRVIGHLNTLLVLMKGQPLAYNRDNQEDKEPLFDTLDTVIACLEVYAAMLPSMTVNAKRMHEAAFKGFSTATDLADYLVRKGVAFRDAHEIVGRAVRAGVESERDLSELSLEELRAFSTEIEDDVYDILTLEGSVASRDHLGGTAPARVRVAAANAMAALDRETN